MILVINLFCFLPISYSAAMQNEQNSSGSDGISIYQIAPDRRGGKAYKLVYLVEVQMDVFWGFKTDFDNNFLVENKYIQEHHLLYGMEMRLLPKTNIPMAQTWFSDGRLQFSRRRNGWILFF